MLGESLSRLRRLQADATSTFNGEALAASEAGQPPDLLQRLVRFGALVGRSFWTNRCQTRAAALAYTTLLALIPLLAVSLSVASLVFDTESAESRDRLVGYIERFVGNVAPTLGLVDAAAVEADGSLVGPPPPGSDAARTAEAVSLQRQKVANEILAFTRKIHFGTIGVTAMAGLIFVAISLLRTIEATFNDIWGVMKGRGWFDSIILYWAAITLGPIIMLVGTTSGYLTALYERSAALQSIPGAALFQTQLLPLLLLWVAFTSLYKLAPNTRVHLASAAVGGAVAVVLWWMNNRLGVLYNTKVVTYSKIYGSLGAVPLFLIGLYFSWLILLFGAQVAYVHQNRRSYFQEQASSRVSSQSCEFIALRAMVEIADRFQNGRPPATTVALAETIGVPERLVARLVTALRQSRLVEEVEGPPTALVPGRPIEKITCLDILRCIRAGTDPLIATRPDRALDVVRTEFEAVLASEAARGTSTSLRDLIGRLPASGGSPGSPEPAVLAAAQRTGATA